jgi:hypothetical protein
MSDIYTGHKLPDNSRWTAKAVLGGARLEPLQSPADGLAKVRFSKAAFDLLVRKKKRKGETVSACVERIILEAPDALLK